MNDSDYMAKAWGMAKKNQPPYQFGAVVVKDSKAIGLDHNRVSDVPDTSAHAEISAIRQACKELGSYQLAGCTLYSTHEPCVMCFACAMWAGMDRVVYEVPREKLQDDMYESSMDIEQLNKTALRSKIIIDRFEQP